MEAPWGSCSQGTLLTPPVMAEVKACVPGGSCSPALRPGEPGGKGWRPVLLSAPKGLAG